MKAFSRATVLYNRESECGARRLGLKLKADGLRPGHFFMLRSPNTIDPLLSRPLGLYRVLDAAGEVLPVKRQSPFSGEGIEFLYNVVGRGTTLLSEKQPGDELQLLGPLGNGFPLPQDLGTDKAIMVGGGMGIVPFYLMAALLKDGLFLFGARGAADAALAEDFSGLPCRVEVSTEDGSVGAKGLVTALLARELTPDSLVYACGPPAMLKAVAAMAASAGARSYVSLEKTMACGIGVCLGCAVKIKAEHAGARGQLKMVCSEGPVFDSVTIDWDDIC